jgi:hypothetical protein
MGEIILLSPVHTVCGKMQPINKTSETSSKGQGTEK